MGYLEELSKDYHLDSQHDRCFEWEFASAQIEKVFQVWPEELGDQNGEIALISEPIELGDAHLVGLLLLLLEDSVHDRLFEELFELRILAFEFDRNVFFCFFILSYTFHKTP